MKLICLGKYGGFPAAGGASTGYLLQAGGRNILLDCGAGVFARLQRYCSFLELDAVILSHLHIDHCSDMGIMRQALKLRGKGEKLDVYMPATPEKVFADINSEPYRCHTVADGGSVDIGGIRVDFTRTAHPVECNAMRIECEGKTLFFTGDTNWFDGLVSAAQGADMLLCDTAFLDEQWNMEKPHLSAGKAGELADRAGVGRLLLTHTVPDMDEQRALEQAKRHFTNTEVVQEGQGYRV